MTEFAKCPMDDMYIRIGVSSTTCRTSDGYLDVSRLCNYDDECLKRWTNNPRYKAFMTELSKSTNIPENELMKASDGVFGYMHIWAHPGVAINIAQWLSPKFEVDASRLVYDRYVNYVNFGHLLSNTLKERYSQNSR